ncbi:MAG: Protein involved in cellulose biosynthesis (CelD)-like [Symbiobacteriaceae bacterium]|jgi:CelD/BcsL family acetyltransferase involved in cellulose biosynthesis|nr:Protein involved in cellulose biosynthesis (CelD)-like [Symbiobacteriaceae bacterium]
MSLTVERLPSFEAAHTVWNRLLVADGHATFFSTPTWLQTWWDHHRSGRELLLLVVREGAEPVGFAPLMTEPVTGGRAVLFLGSGLSDYADVLVDESRAGRRDTVYALLDYLGTQFRGALFDFQQIPSHSPTLGFMQEWLRERSLAGVTAVQDVCPVIRLPETPEEYHKELRKSFLADIRRGERRLRERGEVVITDHITPADGDWTGLRDQMSELQSQRMRTKGEIPMWQGPLGAFVKDVLAATDATGQLRLTGVYLDGKLIAYELCFLHKTTIFAWSRAFDEEHRNTGPGKIALLHLLETGIGQGYRLFDLLRGEEPYKELWTNGQIQNMRLTFVVRPSLGALVAYKYRTSWKEQLRKLAVLRRLNRLVKSLRGG